MKSYKVLVISPVANVPEYSGNSQRVQSIIELLKEMGADIHYCLVETPFISMRYIDAVVSDYWGDKIDVLYLDLPIMYRIRRFLLACFKGLLFKINSGYRLSNEILDYNLVSGWVGKKQQKYFENIVDNFSPDALVFEYAIMSELISSKKYESINKICDTHDVFTERNNRLRNNGIEARWLNMKKYQESNLLSYFDYIWAIQDNELKQLRNIVSTKAKLLCIDITRPPAIQFAPMLSSNNAIGFISSYNEQNMMGLRIFLDNVWPLVLEKLPNAVFKIAGSICSELHNIESRNVKVIGKVESLDSFYSSVKVVVNPVLGGTGLKIKTIEALSHGRCIVSSVDGADGLAYLEGMGVFTSSDFGAIFASKIILLLENDDLLNRSASKALEVLSERYKINRKAILECLGG